MCPTNARVPFKILVSCIFAFGTLFAVGCGDSASGGGDDANKCEGVQCHFGACDSETGKCANLESCNVNQDCVPGYECVEGTCSALQECSSDSDCDAGVCDEDSGACVNPDSCESNSDCQARTYCDESGECAPDPCNEISCQRGTCQRGTDQCVSKESCTAESELIDCVAGEKCADGECLDSDSFCETVSCDDGGVCDFQAGGCVDAENCEGDDANCVEGKFCNDQDRCRDDLCAQNDVTCEGNGVCIPATGTCENADSCESTEDCVTNHLCVEGTCRLAATACGDADGDGGCPGDQTCEYDEENNTASCAEPDTCDTSFDCTGDRQCGGEFCLEAESCADDRFESNDSADEATVFHEVAEENSLEASVCTGDTDIFTVNTNEIYEPAQQGTLVIQVDVPAREQGLGQVDLKVLDPDGDELGTDSTGALGAEGRAELTEQINAANHGEYTVEVSAGDDLNDSGVNYRLSANMIPADSVDACQNATEIKVNQRVSGDTSNSDSTYLDSSCTGTSGESETNQQPEEIFRLEVDSPQEVTFNLEPQLSSSDLSMSLRKGCAQPATEIACTDDAGEGSEESLTALLGEGTYYLIVQAPPGEDVQGGPFELNVDRVFTACSSQDDYCDSDGKAHTCTVDGGRFQEIDCDAGCNPSTGFCQPPAGDRCGTADTIDPNNADQQTIKLNQLTNNYEISADSEGCLGSGDTRTSGPDQTYELTVPGEQAVTATVRFDNEVEGSLALVENCADVDGTCETGAIDSVDGEDYTEELTYANQSTDDETWNLIVDTAAGQEVTTATLEITYEDVVCTPDAERCSGSNSVEQCEEFGRSWESIQDCSAAFGCDAGACTADTCASAPSVPTDFQTYTYNFNPEDFTNNYDIDNSTCMENSYDDSPGPEAVVKVDLQQGDLIDATWDHDDPSFYIIEDCSNVASSCLAGIETYSDEEVGLIHKVADAGTYYIVADVDEATTTNYREGTLNVRAGEPPCDPATYTSTCDGSGNLLYCVPPGFEETYACTDGCSNGECGTKTGGICADAKPVQSGDTESEVYDGINSLDPEATGNTGGCTFPEETAGADFIYEVELQANEQLTADYDGDSSFDVMYLLGDCSDTSTCIEAVDNDGSIDYTAGSSAETVYVVLDHESYTDGGTQNYSFNVDINVQ